MIIFEELEDESFLKRFCNTTTMRSLKRPSTAYAAHFGYTSTLSLGSSFLPKTGRQKLVTREAQRTTSLSTLFHFVTILPRATLQILGPMLTNTACWVR